MIASSSIVFTPVSMIQAPNAFHELPQWDIVNGQAITLWLRVEVRDGLGTRRRIPAAGATIKLRFPRARQQIVGGAPALDQTFEVAGMLLSDDRSMASFPLTVQNTQAAFPGTVLLVITEGTTVTTVQGQFILKKHFPAGTC